MAKKIKSRLGEAKEPKPSQPELPQEKTPKDSSKDASTGLIKNYPLRGALIFLAVRSGYVYWAEYLFLSLFD